LTNAAGSATFSYKVEGTLYAWYEKPFVGFHIAYYYCFLASIALAVFLIIISPLVCVISVVIILCGTSLCCYCCCCRKNNNISSKPLTKKVTKLSS